MKEGFPHVNRTVNLKNWAVTLRKGTVLHQDLLEIGNLLKADAADYIREKKEKKINDKNLSLSQIDNGLDYMFIYCPTKFLLHLPDP